jgi:hypothetical protein
MAETGPLIDGAVPRTGSERCQVLLDYATNLYKNWDPLDLEAHSLFKTRLDQLKYEVQTPRIIYDGHWIEVEDDLIDLINDLLPMDHVVYVGEPNPGDIIIDIREVGAD